MRRDTPRVRPRALAAALIVAAAATLSAGEHTDGRMRVRAVVTNQRGEPLAGLRARDFELRADDVAQEIESAQFTSVPEGSPRVFALFLDEFHVDAAATAAVRDAVARFVDTSIRPADVVFALRPLDPLTSIEPIGDRAHLTAIIAAFQGRKGDYTPRTTFEEKYMPQAAAAVALARAQIVTSALRALAIRVSDISDARAAIVFVSDGFDRVRTTRESPADLQAVIRPALGAAVPVYAVSAAAPAADAVETVPGASAVRALATQTGGEFTSGAESLSEAMARISRDLDTHYVLTYRPSHGDDGRFHSLRVNVKRQNVRIRARSGYLAPMSPQMRAARAAAATSSLAARALRRSPLIDAWSGFTRGADGSARVMLTWEPRKLATPVRRPTPEAIVLTASTPRGEVLFHGRVAPVGRLQTPDTRDSAVFDAPAGRLLVDINVIDRAGGVMDIDARDVDVPDLQKPGVVMLPPSVLRARSAREFREVSADPDASPAASREFRRTDRLLLRVPLNHGSGGAPVSATLLNGWRQPMRVLTAMPGSAREGVTQFDVPLAPLAPGEYVIRITGPGVSEHIAFRVTG